MKKLTKVQFYTLELLFQGDMITIDSMNCAWIGEKPVAPVVRYFLTSKRLVTRKDKTKKVETKGNGYILTEKGKEVFLANQ